MRLAVLAILLILGSVGANGGCSPDSSHIGVQDYGSVTGRVIDAKTNAPVPSAQVSVGTTVTAITDPQGAFTLNTVPEGDQTVTVSAAGYVTQTVGATVHKNQTTQLDYIKLVLEQ